MQASKIDPVCGMVIENDDIKHVYAGIEYWFCQDQCKQRFIDRPQLFIGSPKRGPSIKQRGKESLRAHYIHLKLAPHDKQIEQLKKNIKELMGIKDIDVEDKTVLVIYDLIQVSFEDIETAIVKAHCDLDTRITERLKRTVIHFAEECDLDTLGRS